MSAVDEVTENDLFALLQLFVTKSFSAGSCVDGSLEDNIIRKCEIFFKKDYNIAELDNTNGILCPQYPKLIFVPEYEETRTKSSLGANNSPRNIKQNTASPNVSPRIITTTNSSPITHQNQQQQSAQKSPQSYVQYQTSTSNVPPGNTTTNTIYEDQYDISKIRELITTAKYARCRQRFVVPVIMYRGKYICRSATVSNNMETYARKVINYAYDCMSSTSRSYPNVDDENNPEDPLLNEALPFTYEEAINSDIQLLESLNVTAIVDLMVENRKIKYFLTVSSSEKADPDNRYENFNLFALPYPGCELFTEFRRKNYTGSDIHFDWNQSFIDADIAIPKLLSIAEINIKWNEYRSWNLVVITQNYLKACLRFIKEEKSGLLIHCISGWDRTPLFVSLVRLSLWADGLIHQSLNSLQMVYFTVAYDWFLFGHKLPDRLKSGEEIMFFCFYVVKYIIDEEFSIVEYRKRTKTSSSSGSSIAVLGKCDTSFDDESLKEDVNLSQDSNDSCDISLMNPYSALAPQGPSNTSVASNALINRSPHEKRARTSPISVPGASATRQRHESSSSIDSFVFLTETASVESTKNASFSSRSMNDFSISGLDNANTPSIYKNQNLSMRKRRLSAVRSLFYRCYSKAVGFKYNEGQG